MRLIFCCHLFVHLFKGGKSFINFRSYPSFQGRKRAEDLNERIMIWSIFVTIAIFMVGFGQVLVLKSFFSEKRPSQIHGYH